MSVETKVEEITNADGNSVSQPIAKPNVVCSQSPEIDDAEKTFSGEPILSKELDVAANKIKVGYSSSERMRKFAEEYFANPEKQKAGVMMITNPENKDEYVLVLPDAYRPDFEFKDYLKTHKVLKQQTLSCD
jgi:hypothetical protein